MYSKEELDLKTREELYSIITELNVCVDKLDNENCLLKNISNKFEIYFTYFDKISETLLSNEVLLMRKQIKQLIAINRKQLKVSVKRLTDNEINGKYCEIIDIY